MPKGSKVLMADDDKMLIDMYQERLELAGYVVTICHNGEEALGKIREVKPDIILLDIMMPKLNGYETLASLKSDPATKDIPVIMLSALMRDFNREKAVEAGADDYLIKSEAMPADVITKIEQVLQKYQKGSPSAPSSIPSSTSVPTGIYKPISPPAPTVSPITPTPAKALETPTPTPATPPKTEETPVINFQPASTINPVPAPTAPKQKSSSTLLIVILTILLTTLVTGALMYYLLK
jgi:CheY-like chemotaxis protein